MLFNRKIINQIHFIVIILLLSSLKLLLNSCESDEIVIYKPTEIGNSCDTNDVSFNEFIKPTLDKKCKGCHNNSDHYAGINLEGYENIKKNALNGSLLGSIYGNMGSFISDDCEIAKIQAWINQGSKNN